MLDEEFPASLWLSDPNGNFEDVGAMGIASFDSKRGVCLNIPVGSIPPDGDEALVLNATRTFDRIYGLAQDNSHLTLIDSIGLTSSSFPGFARETWTASTALVSKSKFYKSDPQVISAIVKIAGLYEWFGQNPVKYNRRYENDNSFVSAVISVNADNLNETLIYKNEHVEISLKPSATLSGGERPLRNQSIASDCNLVFRFSNSMPTLEDAIKDYIVPFRDFLSLFMGFRAEILTITFSSAEEREKIDAFIPFVEAKHDALNKSDLKNMPFTFSTLENKIQKMYGKWLELPDDGRRAANIMLGILSNERSLYLDLNMIAAASAFEALSRIDNRTYELDEDTFNHRLQVVNDNIPDPKIRNWAMRHLKNSNFQLAGTLATQMLESLEPLSSYIVPDSKSFLANHRKTRNAYIHQNNNVSTDEILSGEALYAHAEAVILLNWGKLLCLLELSPEEIVDALRETKYRQKCVSRARDLYSLKDPETEHGDK